jgi:hypothetical protein
MDRSKDATSGAMRRKFVAGFVGGMRVVWPVVSGLLLTIAVLGVIIGRIEGWSIGESLYFASVTGLTIGYGDFAPTMLLTRVLAIGIGLCGVLLIALVAAIAVEALAEVRGAGNGR